MRVNSFHTMKFQRIFGISQYQFNCVKSQTENAVVKLLANCQATRPKYGSVMVIKEWVIPRGA